MKKAKRTQLIVDREFQSHLLMRSVAYWGVCMLGVGALLAYWQLRQHKAVSIDLLRLEFWRSMSPVLLLSLGFMPVLAYDLLRVSQRAAGPVMRLRSALQEVAQGKLPPPLAVRQDDYWKGLFEDFNAVLARLRLQQHAGAAAFRGTDPDLQERVEQLVR